MVGEKDRAEKLVSDLADVVVDHLDLLILEGMPELTSKQRKMFTSVILMTAKEKVSPMAEDAV